MDNFERQIEEETNERIEQACVIEREVTARRCLEICLTADSVAIAIARIRQAFALDAARTGGRDAK